jgi:hypothetical protein
VRWHRKLWYLTPREYIPRLRGRMSEQETAGRETLNWYTMSEESAWFEQVGRSVFSKAVRKAQEMVARGDITLGPDHTRVPVEVGEENFILGIQQGNSDDAEGGIGRRVTICCRCHDDCIPGDDCITICYGPCCPGMVLSG